jgi:hypothetical protein
MATFLITHVTKLTMWINYIIIWPVLIALYNLLILANIVDLIDFNVDNKEKLLKSQIGLQKFDENKYIVFFYFIHCTIILFCIFTRILTKYFITNKDKNRIDLFRPENKNLGESLVKYYILFFKSIFS